MLNVALALTVASGATAQIYPDELDILRGADVRPQVALVLDSSGSMNSGAVNTSCAYYYSTVAGYSGDPALSLNKMDLLKAVLTGCQSPNDGVLDQWANQVFFAVYDFDGSVTLVSDFTPTTGNLTSLESAVMGLSQGGLTALAEGYAAAANRLANYWNDTNSAQCRQNYIVLMTDGDGNTGGSPTLSISSNPNAAVTFVNTSYGTPNADLAARYLARSDSDFNTFVDSMPNITGTQPIRTYTLGFGSGISGPGQTLLQNMAWNGDGQYYAATGYTQLNNAFTQIILSVVARSNVSFTPASVQNDGLFSGNYVYSTSFKPFDQGAWFGNTKKHCVAPTGPSDTTCVFLEDPSGNLVTNPNPPVDIWTGNANAAADVGGTGQVIWSNLFGGVTGPSDPVPSNPLTRRRIFTWRPGSTGYVAVDGTSTWDRQDSYARNDCEHHSVINRLHGFTADVTDCAGGNYAPAALEAWPIGDTVHGDTVIIKYTPNCELNTDTCFVATVANDGMLHFYDASSGVETSAIVPGHLWSDNQIATHQLRDILDQPNLSEFRRYYFDGGVRLFHDDQNGNGFIDGGESAKLIAGLGRGGRSYIMWDVSQFNGIPDDTNNPPQELMVDTDSSLKHLRETWAAPWVGRYRHTDGTIYPVAVFPSGHDRELDKPLATLGGFQTGLPPSPGDTRSTPFNQGCPSFFPNTGGAGVAGAMLCNPPFPTTGCTPCNTLASCAFLPIDNCYDWPGLRFLPGVPVPFDQNTGTGHNILLGPFSWSTGSEIAVGYRVIFSHFDLQPGDYIAFLDSNQNEIYRIDAACTTPTATCINDPTVAANVPWIDDSTFHVRLVTDGNDSQSSTGFSVQRIEMLRASTPMAATGTWRPSIYMVDINRWNGPANAPATKFPAQPGAGDTRQQTGMLLRITSDCEGLQTGSEVCLDATGSGGQPPQPDLAFMTCPISHEPSVLTTGGLAEGIYWGDECGQIFRATRDGSGQWSAKRLLHASNIGGSNASVTGASKDFRKIFADFDIVRSSCNGDSAIGVYFGTGNLQRPAVMSTPVDNLQDPAVAGFTGMLASSYIPDVFGVVWDHATLPTNAGLENLENITNSIQVTDPRSGNARNGWIIELLEFGKVLREPVVFDGVAYFQEFTPLTPATECVSATSVETTFAIDNCTGRPETDGDGSTIVGDSLADRYVSYETSDIGGGVELYTPPGKTPVVKAGVTTTQTNRTRPTRFMMWRTIVDPLF